MIDRMYAVEQVGADSTGRHGVLRFWTPSLHRALAEVAKDPEKRKIVTYEGDAIPDKVRENAERAQQ